MYLDDIWTLIYKSKTHTCPLLAVFLCKLKVFFFSRRFTLNQIPPSTEGALTSNWMVLKTTTRKHHSCGLFFRAFGALLHLFELARLPNATVFFDWPQFWFGVRGQGTPRGLGAESYGGTGGGLLRANVSHDPESPDRAVHPGLQLLPHQGGLLLRLLQGGLTGRQLQYVGELLEALLQIHVTWWTCVYPTMVFWREEST